MKALALVALLAAQQPEIDLAREEALTRSGTAHALVTLIAVHEDGTPVRGFISCGGFWQKYQDGEEVFVEALPFRTDARGAIVMNPRLADEWIVCWAEQDGARGKVIVDLTAPTSAHVITVTHP